MRRGGRAVALWIACVAGAGCLSDLTKPPGQDGGSSAGDGGGDQDGRVVGPRCDPAGPFDEPAPLETIGGSINDGTEQAWPRVSQDDLTLYYIRAPTRVGAGVMNGVVMRVGRAGDDPAAPFDMGSQVAEEEFVPGDHNEAPVLSADGRRLFYNNASAKTFASDRGGTVGLFPYPGDELGINASESRDVNPYLVGDDTLFFASSRRHEDGTLELYRSMAQDGGLFEVAEPMDIVTDPPHMQFAPVVSSDGRVVFFSADGRIYRAVRRPEGMFGMGEEVEELNDKFSFPGSLSPDDCVLYFHSDRRIAEDVDYDIYAARATITF